MSLTCRGHCDTCERHFATNDAHLLYCGHAEECGESPAGLRFEPCWGSCSTTGEARCVVWCEGANQGRTVNRAGHWEVGQIGRLCVAELLPHEEGREGE